MPSCQVKFLHEEWLKGNQLWQPSCRNPKGVRREKIRIVATKLPEMGGKKEKRKKKELWQKFNSDLGNGVAEN